MSEGTARPFCRRCLLADVPEGEALSETLRAQLAQLPPEKLAAEDVRAARLAECRRCDRLTDGLCGLCGCYVEYRAALRARRCPDVPGRW